MQKTGRREVFLVVVMNIGNKDSKNMNQNISAIKKLCPTRIEGYKNGK